MRKGIELREVKNEILAAKGLRREKEKKGFVKLERCFLNEKERDQRNCDGDRETVVTELVVVVKREEEKGFVKQENSE